MIEVGRVAIAAERERLRAEGFLGVPGRVLAEVEDAGHLVRVVEYDFPHAPSTAGTGRSPRPFVEVVEWHEGARRARIWGLPDAVHCLQNVSWEEFFAIGGRERPGGGA